MKNALAVLALAASVAPATATFGFVNDITKGVKSGIDFDGGYSKKWQHAPIFECPSNSDNKCDDKWGGGFDFKDLIKGPFEKYKGFDFKGWSCEDGFDGFDKGDKFSTYDKPWDKLGKLKGLKDKKLDKFKKFEKAISGICGGDRETAPSFGCGADSGYDKFTLKEFDVDVEFDCRLEFHYDMPDGSFCKHSSDCFKGAKNTIKNTQCGGAKKVRIIYPPQLDKPKDKCKIKIPKIDFDCDDNTPPELPTPELPTPEIPTPSVPGWTTTTTPAEEWPTTSSVEESTTSTPVEESTTSTPVEGSTTTTPWTTPGSSTTPKSSSYTTPSPSYVTVPSSASTPSSVGTPSSAPSISSASSSTAPGVSTIPDTTGPITTTYDSTSTVYTTSTSTITSCGPEVPDCPAGSTTVVTETIPVSTTICPVTETLTKPPATPTGPVTTTYDSTSTVYTTSTSTITSCGPEVPDCPAGSTTVVTKTIPVSTTICPVTETLSTPPTAPTDTPDVPDEEVPFPEDVPKCINTWLKLVKDCKDNLDAACYCPSKDFVEKTYACLYSHGKSDDAVSQAVQFFQGLCAPYIDKNPGIVTGIETVTSCITVTGTPTVTSVPYTTIAVETTVVEPGVSNGVPVPSSSTTKVISTEITVPQISVPTANEAAPVKSSAVPVAPSTAVPFVPEKSAPAATSPSTPKGPIGTVGLPTPTNPLPVPTAGAARLGAGMGAGLLAVAAAALL